MDFLGHIKSFLGILTHTGPVGAKKSRGEHPETYLRSMCKRMTEQELGGRVSRHTLLMIGRCGEP